MKKFFGSWDDLVGLQLSFDDGDHPVPDDLDVIFAVYGGGSYEGAAVVVYRRDGKLYEVQGGHCSCYGLEGQWDPEEATVESLRKTVTNELSNEYSYEDDARMGWAEIAETL